MASVRWKSNVVAACTALFVCACGTGNTKIDPGDLELRDLLGVAPEAAQAWDTPQREAARRVLVAALDDGIDDAIEPLRTESVEAPTIDDRVTRSLATLDAHRFADGDDALGLVVVELAGGELGGTTRRAPRATSAALSRVVATGTAPATEPANEATNGLKLDLSDRWGVVPLKSREVLVALARDAGHTGDRLIVVPSPRLAVIASYVREMGSDPSSAHLVVNPVLLAALDPAATELVKAPAPAARVAAPAATTIPVPGAPKAIAAGNPYSFYGSVAECAYAQRLRCESCLSSNNCEPVTSTSDGNAECTTLGENDGRGYFLLCINLAVAISSVDECAADSVNGCARDTEAASNLARLEANANFLDDATCSTGLDRCLAQIYGAPGNPFPGLVDGGVEPPPDPPRETSVSCNDSCDQDKSSNCEFSPNCDCSGPSCGNSFSCDSSCASSNGQSGCGDNCDSCSSDSGGSSSGGACGADSGGSSSSSNSSCGSSGDSCGGDSCGGGSCGGGDCGGDCGGGGGGGGCQVARKAPNAAFAVGLSMTWALLPVPLAAALKRRARRRKRREPKENADEEVTS
jgi:hypothetical protein